MSQFQSSGDLAADRRYLWAEASLADGDVAAAADLFAQALDVAPHWAAAAFALGAARARLGDADGARQAFEQCLRLAPDDAFGARLHLARLTGAAEPPEMPSRYVAALFDDYADRFDTHLVTALDYRAPHLLRALLIENSPPGGPVPRFAEVLDLGCGTGLMGVALGDLAGDIDGVDLSPRMLDRAAATARYRRLWADDILTHLAGEDRVGRYDLVIAADVFVYLGALVPVLTGCLRVLRPGGRLAFTVQSCAGDGYRLGEDLRYAHSASYIDEAARVAGLRIEAVSAASTRKDAGAPVPGLLCLLSRPG